MKFFKALAILTLFVSGASNACQISGTGLTEVQKQELTVQCEQMALDAKKLAENPLAAVASGNTDPEQLSQWGVIAQEWAKALGIAAKELGIAVDGFLDTDAGKLTAFVIVWQFLGDTIMGVVLGVPLFITILIIGLRVARSIRVKNIQYGDRNWIGVRRVESVEYYERMSETRGTMTILAYIVTVVLAWMTVGLIIIP